MRKIKILTIATLSLVIVLFGCKSKVKIGDTTENSIGETLSLENFESFYQKFNSDSTFQLSRIVFPLISETEVEIEKRILEDGGDLEVVKKVKKNFIPHDKNNWIVLRDLYFKNDSVATIGEIVYKRRFFKKNDYVEENILFADPEQLVIIIKYKLIKNKWYLVDYVNDLEYE